MGIIISSAREKKELKRKHKQPDDERICGQEGERKDGEEEKKTQLNVAPFVISKNYTFYLAHRNRYVYMRFFFLSS